MPCLKCGKETEEKQVFCPDCQQSMHNYPVKPGTPVQLHHREVVTTEKKAARNKKLEEDPITTLHRVIRWLLAAIGLLVILVCVLAALLLEPQTQQAPGPVSPNQIINDIGH